jgi:hypothetical protein
MKNSELDSKKKFFSLLVSKIENDVAVVGKAKIRIRGSMHEVVESD